MNDAPAWWVRPRRVAVVVGAGGWMLPYARELVVALADAGDDAQLYHDHERVPDQAIAFYLSYDRIVPRQTLERTRRSLIAHASDLPEGRGMSPLTWQILEGRNRIPVCLFEAVEALDAGPVVYRECLEFEGHELIDEMRAALGRKIVALCRRFLDESTPPAGTPQQGEPSYWRRRFLEDSALNPEASIASQFELLRVVDNDRYPAFFDWRGHRYYVHVTKASDVGGDA